jgi:hypothetical protein
VLKAVSLEREAIWAASVLATHAIKLNTFLEYRARLDPLLLNGTYDECNSILEDIENSLGHSLWSVELRLALLSVWKGIESQKAYTSAILDSSTGNFVRFFVSHVSQRNEDSTNPFRFQSSFQAIVDKWNIAADFRAYLLYRISDDWQNTAGTVRSILRIEAISPIIDYYETFVRIATRAIASASDTALSFHGPVALLARAIRDSRLDKLISFIDSGIERLSDFAPPSDSLRLLDHFAEGRYPQILDELHQMVVQERDEVALSIGGQCYAETGGRISTEATFFERLLGLCARLIVKDEGIDEPFTELMRWSHNFRFASFATGLQEFASRQLSSAPLPDREQVCRRFLSSRYLDVGALASLPSAIQLSLGQYLSTRFPHSIGVASEIARLDLPDSEFSLPERVSKELRSEIELERAFRRGDDVRVVALATTAYTAKSVYFKRFAARLHANSLLRLNYLEEAIDLIVATCLVDIGSVRMLPLRDCIDRMDKKTSKHLAHKLPTPILLDLFTRNIDDRQRELREFTYEDFLIAHGVERPSELGTIADDFDRRELVYYLRFVCVPEVMQVSPAFQNSQSLEDERLEVCTLLVDLDKSNVKVYEREIDEITRRQLIQRGVRQVERSKISIDLDPLRRWAHRSLKDSFTRFNALQAAGFGTDAKYTDEVKNLSSGFNELELPEVPIESAITLLLTTIRSLLHECFHNSQHGLDCYLSMRVRHGALSGQLRAALEDEKIITQRKGGSDDYARNNYWLERLGLPGNVAIDLDKRLRRFARDYDDLIREFAANKVQIRSDSKPDALFADEVPKSSLGVLALEIHSETTFESFLDLCFDTFSHTVEDSLQLVRNYIDNTLKIEVNALFVSLLADAEKITAGIATSEFDTAMRNAQTRTQQALDGVKDWFRQVNPPPPRSFSFEELVHIGLQQVKKRSPGFDPILECHIAEMPQFANLALFSDIFVILFENVSRHSGLMDKPRVVIRADIDDPYLRISFDSMVAPDAISDDARNKVMRIRNTIADGSFHSGIRSEGGTGLIKLGNIAKGDRFTAGRFRFGFSDTGTFNVQMELPLREVELNAPEGALAQ